MHMDFLGMDIVLETEAGELFGGPEPISKTFFKKNLGHKIDLKETQKILNPTQRKLKRK